MKTVKLSQTIGHRTQVQGLFKARVFYLNKQVEDLQNRAKQRAMKILRHSPQ